jgi:hypothetical protein
LTAGTFGHDTIVDIRGNFVRNKQVYSDVQNLGADLFFTQEEGAEILKEERFTNKDYYTESNSADGSQKRRLLGFRAVEISGNETGKTATNLVPVLPENNGVRSCVSLAPQSLSIWEGDVKIDYMTEHEMKLTSNTVGKGFVHSVGLIFTFEYLVFRNRGFGAQIINTTI